jgi:hypothetical protein
VNPSTDLHPARTGPASEPVPSPSAEELLAGAHAAVIKDFGSADVLSQAVLHLVDCASHAATCLPHPDLTAARLALESARSAVVAATYAVRMIHDQGEGVVA